MADLPPSFDAPPSFAPPPQGGGQPPQQGVGGLAGGLGIAKRSFLRGYEEGSAHDESFTSEADQQRIRERMRSLGLATDAPSAAPPKQADWAKPLTAAEKAEADAQAKQDKTRGGFWLSTLPHFTGEQMASGPGGLVKAGAARVAGPVVRAIESASRGMGEAATERWPSVSRAIGNAAQRIPGVRGTFMAATDPATLRGAAAASSRGAARDLAQSGSLAAAHARDVTLSELGQGTIGLRSGEATGLERLSANLPGGAPVRRAIAAGETRAQGLRADEIAQNLAAQGTQGISTSASAYGRLTAAERQRIATFWRSGAPDRVWQALRDPQQLQLIQQATAVLSPNSQRYLASEMLSRMGRTRAGAFSADQFLRDWGAMSVPARDAVFGSRAIGSDYARDVTEIASNVERIQAYAQRSGLLKSMMSNLPQGGGLGMVAAGAGIAIGAEHILGPLLNLKTAGIIVAASGANIGLAQALTNPSTAKFLAVQTGKMVAQYEAAQSNQFSQGSKTQH